jgi:uncharacterized protein (TIGR01777 family)
MRVFITGGTGFVGRHLTRAMLARGHAVTVLSRSPKRKPDMPDGVEVVEGDPTEPGPWQRIVSDHDAVVNLAGAPIFKRWSEDYKRTILESRISTTINVVDALKPGGDRVPDLLNASAVGYYGFRDDTVLDETAGPGGDFLAGVAQAWEREASRAAEAGARVVFCRFGIVLGSEGGALLEMIERFRRFGPSVLGTGRQWFSWIHVEDLAEVFLFLLQHRDISGPVNCVAPGPVTNRQLTEAIAERMGRSRSRLSVPGFALKLLMGDFAEVLLNGQRVRPAELLAEGFEFRFGDIRTALEDLIKQ